MEFKKPIRRRPKIQAEPKPKKVEPLYAILNIGKSPRHFATLEEATEDLQPSDKGIYKLVRRAKFNKVVEDVE